MGKPENSITRFVKRELNEHGIYCFKIWQGPFSRPGIADLIGLTPDGRFVAVEVKANGGRLTDHQEAFLNRIRSNNGIGFIARGAQDVRTEMAAAGVEREQRTLF